LASLALALGLVEIAARAGGKLDSLFLDEGFGSLDADSLDEALNALDERARQGRLVVLVSHIKAVAEHDGMQDVLEVKRTANGSVLRWLDRTQQDELVLEELRGLLPAQ
jgi:exonuclease SbcC